MNDIISIDSLTIKALSVETRVKILKLLLKNKLTQTDIAENLKLTIPSIKEHLDFLVKSNLVNRLEEGRKWKYYQVTDKTKSLFNSEYYKFVITLGIFVISAGLSFIISLQKSATFIMEKSEIGVIGEAVIQKPSLAIPIIFSILIIYLILTIVFWFKYRKTPYKIIRSLPE